MALTLAEIARVIGGEIDGRALHVRIDGVHVEITREHAPLTSSVVWRTHVFCDHHAERPSVEDSDGEFVYLVSGPAQPNPELPGHVFGGLVESGLHATSIGEPTLDDLRITVAILVDLAKMLPAPRYEKVTTAEVKRRARIEHLKKLWKQRAPRLLFVAAVTLVVFVLRRR